MAPDLSRLFGIVAARLAKDPGVSEQALATDLGVDRKTICRAVRATTGQHFRAWSRRQIMSAAALMLCESPDQPVSEVAARFGFSTVQAFDKAFHREFNLSPTTWRVARLRKEGTSQNDTC